MNSFRRVCLIGLDRTNGSFALGLKRSGFKGSIVGVADAAASSEAWKLGIINGGGPDLAERLAGSDLVMLASNVHPTDECLAQVLELADDEAVVCETSRFKGEMHRLLQSCPRTDLGLVGLNALGLPDPTSALSGATKFFFDGKTVVLTPRGDGDEPAALRLQQALEKMGAKTVSMTAEMHDRWLGLTTQLPGLAGLALLQSLLDSPLRLRISADAWGQRLGDELRSLAAALPGGWLDDIEKNREGLVVAIDELLGHLQIVRQDLASGALARRCNELLTQAMPSDTLEETPIEDTSLMVVAGADAKMIERAAEVLAVARIPVASIQKVQGMDTGTFRLTLKSAEERNQAVYLLRRAGIGIVELSS